ncbi:T-complex protein 1 subunit theta-like [Stylophora pistillata]|uniref:T-complex protein 1 subunit theta n=1 Tax=Stylophora pistillata TaxID=50429 RepID=A0A2B4RCK8_STYPI|nr:T-complex protein 1 subunit theta-like [Stylophora pistillata]PFX16094.1 T-complex protein 1 subunit theta [Stylophora pistillata]
MALPVPKTMFQHMLKEGAKHYSGLDEAVFRNITACRQFTQITRSSLGPNGMNKMVVNHLEKLFVTNDAATIIKELEVQHPAAKMLVLASQMQEQEVGDGTNFVLVFAGALLDAAEELLRMGLSPPEVIEGYEKACKKALEILPELSCSGLSDVRDKEEVAKALKTAVGSKQYGNEDFLAKIITDACVSVLPEKAPFNVDNIRVAKILGSGLHNSEIVQGMVFKREVEGDINALQNAKIVAFSCPLDAMTTETKGTVLIRNAEELKSFSKGEEEQLEKQLKSIVDTGVNCIVSGGKVAEMALHFCNKFNILVVRLTSKFDLRRLCRSVGATILPKFTTPTSEEIGYCDEIKVSEIGGTSVTIFKQEREETAVSTVVIRGSTENIMDDIERAVDDGVNTFKALTRDDRFVPGAGATEIELAKQISSFGETCAGLEQYAIKRFAESLEIIPRTLAENAGVKATEVISKLYAAHQAGDKNAGFDNESGGAAIKDAVKAGILDLYLVKYWALKFATDAAVTVLRVDQIIMSKPAGGPKPKDNPNWDED